MKEFTQNFQRLNKNDVAIAGGKGASLGEMTQRGIPVPPGFVVLAGAFDSFINREGLRADIDSIVRGINHHEARSVERASKKIQALILGEAMPQDIETQIMKSCAALNTKYVAVRSSATAEDSSTAAWAGQLESYLNTTKATLLDHVKKCWASLYTPRAIYYRFEKKLHRQSVAVAVVVQKMVNSEQSGIGFSVHPVTQDHNQLVIEAGLGLGEAIVSGQITPDNYVVTKKPLRIKDRQIIGQARGIFRAPKGGNKWKAINKAVGKKPALSDAQVLTLAKLMIKIEKHYGFPVDIEWAREKGKFYIVQSRPITTLNAPSVTKKLLLSKQHIRDYCLLKLACWTDSDLRGLKRETGSPVRNTLFLSNGDYVKAYYQTSELDKIFSRIGELAVNRGKARHWINKYQEFYTRLEPYFRKRKEIGSLSELKQFFSNYCNFWKYLAIIFVIPNIKKIAPADKKLALKVRQATQEYTEADDIFRTGLKNCLPKVPVALHKYILPQEIFGQTGLALAELKKRKNGFIYFEDRIYTGENKDKFIKENHVIFDDEQISTNVKSIKGQVAYPGKVKGGVKICMTIKDTKGITSHHILVAPMTTPDFLPAMKKAAAFVTDEGGITCHAAIVAREMKKPCLIGTKIATQVLRDGDMIEVDANEGMVKKISSQRAQKKHFSPKNNR